MNHVGTIKMETERLVLRPFKISDAKNMYQNYMGSENVQKYLSCEPFKTVEEVKQFLSKLIPLYKEKTKYYWAIVWKENNQVIGCIDKGSGSERKRRAEIGWAIGEAYWGKGIAAEAAKKVVELLFEVGYERIQAMNDVKNPNSGRVAQKIGMTYEGTLRRYVPNRDGTLADVQMWSIIKGENNGKQIQNK